MVFLIGNSDESKIFIRSVTFNDNNNIDRKEILYIIRQKPSSLFSGRSKFDSRLLRLDLLTLKNYYFSKGFLDVTLKESYLIDEISQKRYVDIIYDIDEGNQYYLSDVQITGNTLISKDRIKSLLGLKTGEPYNPVGLNNNLYLIENDFHEFGKLFSSIVVQDNIKDSVSVDIVIEEGMDIYINNTKIERIGNIDTSIVMRELLYNFGDLYSKSKIDKTAKHLREIGIFSTANLIPLKVTGSDSLVDILIELRRYKQREWNSSGGLEPISFTEGAPPLPAISAIIEWKNRALFNSPKQFSMKILAGIPIEKVEFVAPRIRSDLSLSSNWFLGIRFPSKIIGYFEKFIIYDQKEYKGSIDRYGANLTQRFQLDGRSFFETKGNWEYFSDESDYNIEERSISLKFNFDKKDNHLYAKNGYHIETIIKSVGFGGSRVYNKSDIKINLYKAIAKGTVFASRFQVGKLWNWNAAYKDYSYEKFYLGGSSSMRGWDVLRFSENAQGNPNGETIRLMTNIELRQKLYKSFGLTIFTDGGLLSNNLANSPFSQLKWDAGIGFTFDTPLGPIRIDYAYQLDNTSKQEIQFGLQSLF